MPALNPEASLKYFVSISAESGAVLYDLSVEFVKEIEAIREDIRRAEGGGGKCHVVNETLQMKYGWQALFVTYLSEDGEIIGGGGHVVSILPDGSVLDHRLPPQTRSFRLGIGGPCEQSTNPVVWIP